MQRRRAALTSTAVAALLLTSCSGPNQGPGPLPDNPSTPGSATTASTGSSTPSPSRTTSTPTEEPGGATEVLVLQRQIELQVGGDGLFLSCQSDDETWQEPPAPAVWMNTLFSSTQYPGHVVLCLRGFETDQPIALTVRTGSSERTTEVTPTKGPPAADENFLYESLPSETLFDGRRFPAYTEVYGGEPVGDGPDGLLVSETWVFVPPAPVRDELAHQGTFTISARQGGIEATTTQTVQTPSTRAYEVLKRTGTTAARRMVVLGYPAGARVPIGLYRRKGRESEQATLVRTLATVEVPPSRVAEVGLEDVLADQDPGAYCVAPPVESETSCAAVEIWPTYPGRALQGDRGDVVRRWQQILIQATIITDRAANRDGFFGPATAKAVESYLENLGIPNPDGEGQLGPNLYTLLTS
jgi:hypothetical protein